jgi:CDP-diacylglycerol--serine O-phosphatidyltransferase
MIQPVLREEPASTPPPRRKRLIAVSLLPAAMTLGNLLCGMFAILNCMLVLGGFDVPTTTGVRARIAEYIPTYLAAAAYLIVASMLFDALDGRLARLTRRTSAFGAQLDSIADIVSFGAAPAVLVVALLLRESAADMHPTAAKVIVRLGVLGAAIYTSCAAIRLARYNVECSKGEEAQRAFSGLPTPGAASLVVALIAFHEAVRSDTLGIALPTADVIVRWLAPLILMALGFLMVSRVAYVHVFNVYLRRRRPPTDLVWVVLVIGLGMFSLEALLLVGALSYVISGLILDAARRRTDPRPAAA